MRPAFSLCMSLVLMLAVVGSLLGTVAARVQSTSPITWEPCATSQLPTRECASFEVPLDYDDPAGPSISLAVARVPALRQDLRIGSLFLNPGGPGNSGLATLPQQYTTLPADLRERFDIVAFDPRGVGHSAPVQCFDRIEDATAFNWRYWSEWVVPADAEAEAGLFAAIEEIVNRCGERNATLLPHLSTANVARDLDAMRAAVGDDQLSYLGTSYGTYLGATYANLFPDRIRALVLDGPINAPSFTSFEHGDGAVRGPESTTFLRTNSPVGSSDALAEFLRQCAAAGPDRCPFAAGSAEDTQAKFDALLASLRESPQQISGPAGTLTVTYSLVVHLVWTSLYATPDWPLLAEGLQLLSEHDTSGFLIAMTGYVGVPPATEYANNMDALWAISCVDTDNPDLPAQFQESARLAEQRNPYFGMLWTYYSLPCAYWPAEDTDRYEGPWNAETSATILILSRVFDPATPHGGAVLLEQTLVNARLLTIDGWGHGYYLSGQSTCANDAMVAYFIDGVVPPAGTTCAEDAPPFGP